MAKKLPPPPAHKPVAQTQKAYITEQMRAHAFLISDKLDENGDSQTNGQALARLIWKEAMGWEETVVDERGHKKLIIHPPIIAMQEKLIDRTDGKILAGTEASQGGGLRASEKVRDLAKGRLAKMAKDVQQQG